MSGRREERLETREPFGARAFHKAINAAGSNVVVLNTKTERGLRHVVLKP